MSDEKLVCPYPGLRPFTETEAVFFKGREVHIKKIMKELSEKKFLMVTGASGDGKSSLIYAGLLPNVNAGFFRGLHPRWATAIFRPGNSPLKSLSDALAGAIPDKTSAAIATSLKYGYTALVDEYKQSSLFLDVNTPAFLALDEKEQKAKKRGAANLLIVVDQFEEFFTNKENFNKEIAIPSNEAQLVMNLLMETSKVAKTGAVPIYIVCTMRSDYIGNAPAFRGLPELIGDNQFFVPRLNRQEIRRVIEEPADLSGSKVSKRLVEHLVNDLDVINTDVLPSLQHALRQIWQAAGNGKEELDIVHYCMAGGMSREDLPNDQLEIFNRWNNTLSKEMIDFYSQQKKLHKQTFSNVLNMHADYLFHIAHLTEGVNLDKEIAQRVLKKAFKCLTKIDDSKAVRNRITLSEITEVVGEKGIDEKKISLLLAIFRKQGNTLVHPFITDITDEATELTPDTLLDITHEALIRNWKLLGQWTRQEHNSVLDFREMEAQLNRWLESEKSKEYLLAAGPYDYFIKWFEKQRPSQPWISRYQSFEIYQTDGITLKPLEKLEPET